MLKNKLDYQSVLGRFPTKKGVFVWFLNKIRYLSKEIPTECPAERGMRMQNYDQPGQEQSRQAEKKSRTILWRRILAAVMALVLIVGMFLGYAAQIRFGQLQYVGTVLEHAAAVTADNTGYLDESTLQRAWKILRYAVGKPKTFDEYEMYASLAIARTEYEEAIPYMQGCIDRYAGESSREKAVLYLRLGSLYALSDDVQNAVASFDSAIATDDTLADAYLLRAQMNSLAGKPDGISEDLRSYDRLTGENPAMAASMAALYEGAGDYENAVRSYTTAIEYSGGKDSALLASRGRCYVLLQKLEPAMQDLNDFFTSGGSDPTGEYNLMLGLCRMEAGEYEKALNSFHNALNAGYVQRAMVLSQCVLCAYIIGDYETVIADGEQCLLALQAQSGEPEANPLLQEQMLPEEVHHWVGLARMAGENYQEAREEFLQIADLRKAPEGVAYYLGLCCAALGENEEAIKHYSKSIEAKQMVSLSLYNRGVAYLQEEKLEEGLTDLVTVLQRNDDADATAAATAILQELGVSVVFDS